MAFGTTLVFGKNGQLATALGRLPTPVGKAAYFAGREDADLEHPTACSALINKIRPALVVNAAAYTKVDIAERETERAMRINGDAAGEIATACATANIPLIHISTDYVFDGSADKPWREEDAVEPLNIYGASKAAGEAAVRASMARHVILRASWVFSDIGSNFVKTMLRLGNERDVLSIVDDQYGTPMPAAHIAAAIDTIAQRLTTDATTPTGTYHLSSEPACSWFSFAKHIFEEGGKRGLTGRPKLQPTTSDDYPTAARRPANSVLDGSKIAADYGIEAADWRDGLEDVLDRIATGNTNESSLLPIRW